MIEMCELQKEIFKRGLTTAELARRCEIDRRTLYNIYNHKHKKLRGDTIGRIALGLKITYEESERLCYGTK